MKLFNYFFILIVGVTAHPSKREIDEETRKVKETFPFMALIRAANDQFMVQEWAVILTDKWLLTSIDFTPIETFDITVESYTDLFTRRRYIHEIESYVNLNLKQAHLYPPFKLIKLKSSIIFGDSRKPIHLAGPNFNLKENQETTVFYLLSKFSYEFEETHEYFKSLSAKVMDERTYKSEVSSYLEKRGSNKLTLIECDPAIINGTLVGFLVRLEHEKELFLKLNSIYDWILNKVPELNHPEYQFSAEKSAVLKDEEFNWKQFLLQYLFKSQDSKFSNTMNISNVSINVSVS